MEKHKEISAEDGTQLFGKELDREFVGKLIVTTYAKAVFTGI